MLDLPGDDVEPGDASNWTVASTCRDRPELDVVREAVKGGLSRLYEEIPVKARLVPQEPLLRLLLTNITLIAHKPFRKPLGLTPTRTLSK